MYPEIFGYPTYFISWGLAALLAFVMGVRIVRSEGVSGVQGLALIGVLTVVIVGGAKAWSALEYVFFPIERPGLPPGTVFGPWQRGFQIPGGALLAILLLYPLCRAFRVPALRVADGLLPMFGLVTALARMGCFLNGCCWGGVCHLPWAMTFPRGSRVFYWHLMEGQIGGPVTHSLPVHPLQLYYVLFGIGIYLIGRYWLPRRSFEGQVWLGCSLIYFAGTFALELLRVPTVHLNLIGCAAMALVMAAGLLWIRSQPRGPARSAA